MENQQPQEQFTSHYNTAGEQVGRLNEILAQVHQASLYKDPVSKRLYLDRMWMELQTYCSKEETINDRLEIIKDIDEINNESKNERHLQYFQASERYKRMLKQQSRKDRVLIKLNAYEKFIRRIMFGLDFLGKRKEDLRAMKY